MSNAVKLYSGYLSSCAKYFPVSAHVDFLLFVLGHKKCVRTQLKGSLMHADLQGLKCWLNANKIAYADFLDRDLCFFYFGYDQHVVQTGKMADLSQFPHEIDFGSILGYPICCCQKIAEIGELGIDAYEEWLVTQAFEPPYELINPIRYREGRAFVSHVPCSTKCYASLRIAQDVAQFILQNRELSIFNPWLQELENYGYHSNAKKYTN